MATGQAVGDRAADQEDTTNGISGAASATPSAPAESARSRRAKVNAIGATTEPMVEKATRVLPRKRASRRGD